MEPVSKRPKKKAKKAAVEEQPAVPVAQNIPTGGYLFVVQRRRGAAGGL